MPPGKVFLKPLLEIPGNSPGAPAFQALGRSRQLVHSHSAPGHPDQEEPRRSGATVSGRPGIWSQLFSPLWFVSQENESCSSHRAAQLSWLVVCLCLSGALRRIGQDLRPSYSGQARPSLHTSQYVRKPTNPQTLLLPLPSCGLSSPLFSNFPAPSHSLGRTERRGRRQLSPKAAGVTQAAFKAASQLFLAHSEHLPRPPQHNYFTL